MINLDIQTRLTNDMRNLQERIASLYFREVQSYLFLVSVSFSTWEGATMLTIQPEGPTAPHTVWNQRDGRFGDGAVLDTPQKVEAVMKELALHSFLAYEDQWIVVNATFQVTVNGVSTDRVFQVFTDRNNGALVLRERDVRD